MSAVSSSSPHPPVASTTSRVSVTKWIIAISSRSLILVGSGVGAIALGLVTGQLMPRVNPKPPLFLRLWTTNTAPNPKPTLNETIVNLSSEERAAIEQEITGIRAQLDVLEARTQRLEAELDLDRQRANLGDRLSNLTTLLATDPSSFDPSAVTTPEAALAEPLKITLPSNTLFTPEGELAADAPEILGAIASDLQQQDRQTIAIAGYQTAETPEAATSLARQQAQSVQRYLTEALPRDYRWLVVGYGLTAQTAATTNPSQQPRIEISTQ